MPGTEQKRTGFKQIYFLSFTQSFCLTVKIILRGSAHKYQKHSSAVALSGAALLFYLMIREISILYTQLECSQRFTLRVNMAVGSLSMDVYRFVVKRYRWKIRGKRPQYLKQSCALNRAVVWVSAKATSCGIIERRRPPRQAECLVRAQCL